MSGLKVQRIQVSRLFDKLSYDISFDIGEPVAIITAPNGCGKTTMLNILAFVLSPTGDNVKAVVGVPFRSFRCFLSNGKQLLLERLDAAEAERRMRDILARSPMDPGSIGMKLLRRVGDYRYSVEADGQTEREVFFSDIFDEYYRSLMEGGLAGNDPDGLEALAGREPREPITRFMERRLRELLKACGCEKPVNFIRASRIQPISIPPATPPRGVMDERVILKSPLEFACEQIGAEIRAATEQYSRAVSRAKDMLPRMFLDGEGGGLDAEQFLEGWRIYSDELQRLQEMGLIAQTDDFTRGKDIASVYADKGQFLSTYLEAFRETTEPLRDIYERLKLFKTILDERNVITGKKAVFSRSGVSLVAGGREIPLDTLSSGEKHDFIMFFNLIFNIAPDGLVLIDEPEISLHIEWQESYLDHLISICCLNGLQAVVATHSPNIISSHFDCIVEKGELDERQ